MPHRGVDDPNVRENMFILNLNV